MNALADGHPHVASGRPRGRSGFKSLAWVGGALATTIAALIGAVLAVFFAATVAMIALMGAALLATAGLALRARRMVRAKSRPSDPQVIEARNIGGHSWVAYGWDRRGH